MRLKGGGGGVVGGKTGRKPDLGDYREDLLQVPFGRISAYESNDDTKTMYL